jgi:type II secretory pathway component PulM
MNPLIFLHTLTPLGKKIIFGLMLVAVLALLFAVHSCQSARTAKTEARLNSNQTEAAMSSGSDAVNTVGEQGGREAAIDAATKENTDAIRNAEGADTPVPPAVSAATRERLCRRAAYSQRPECLQYAPAK